MNDIEGRTTRQESTMNHLDSLVKDIADISESTLNNAKQTSTESHVLSDIAHRLNTLVSTFKSEEDCQDEKATQTN